MNVTHPAPTPTSSVTWLRRAVDVAAAENAARDLLHALGADITDESLADTPGRVARMYAEMLTPEPFDLTTFPNDEGYDEVVIARNIPFHSLCEHHLPLSVFWCHNADGTLRCVVAEVHNTHGERHCYLLTPGERGHAETDKAFYVSPFLTVDGRYRMSFSTPGERLSIQMELVQNERRVFQASLTARRRPMTAASLAAMAVRHPLMTARVSALIRYQGVKLWLRGVPRIPRPRRSPQERVG